MWEEKRNPHRLIPSLGEVDVPESHQVLTSFSSGLLRSGPATRSQSGCSHACFLRTRHAHIRPLRLCVCVYACG